MGLFKMSTSSFDSKETRVIQAPNPDPSNYKILVYSDSDIH